MNNRRRGQTKQHLSHKKFANKEYDRRKSGDDSQRSPKVIIGIIIKNDDIFYAQPVSKKNRHLLDLIPHDYTDNLGDLVKLSYIPRDVATDLNLNPKRIFCKIDTILRKNIINTPKGLGMIALNEHELPFQFPDDVLDELNHLPVLNHKYHTDITEYNFVTIDPFDARDHDDAVYAVPDTDSDNVGGFIVYVAIADVAYYVRSGSKIDLEAYKRGNSIYLPDQVVPMLPEKLSNDLCSLKSGQVRPALVVKIKLSSQGQKLNHSFSRCLIKCAANLSYEEVFRIANNTSEDYLQPYKTMLKSLFDAYHAVKIESKKRSPLNLDMPEYKIHLDDTGRVTNISIKQSLFTHNLIEEFMVLANVCAAQTLEDKKSPVIYRIHEVPSKEKTVMLKEVLSEMGFSFAKGQVLKPMAFNKILEKAEQSEFKDLIHKMVLRCQAQAIYHTENEGHFGLNLARYAHFTSPIRRYADLFVHRALVSALDLGSTGLSEFDMQNAAIIADYISKTERKAMQVEMETKDRYYAQFMQDKVGLTFNAVVSGVSSAGLFIKIPEYGAEGLIPIGSLSYGQKRYFILEQEKNMLVDKRSGDYYVLGQTLSARLSEVTPITGGMRFDLTDDSHIIENKRKSEKKQRAKKENTRVKNKKKSVS